MIPEWTRKNRLIVYMAAGLILGWFLGVKVANGSELRWLIPPYAECKEQHRKWFKTANESRYNADNWRAVAIWHAAWRAQDVRFDDAYRKQMRQGVESMTKGKLPWHGERR